MVDRLEAIVATAAVVVVVSMVDVVIEVAEIVVMVDVDDRLGLHFTDPGHRRLLRQLRTLMTVLAGIEAGAFVSSEAVVSRTLSVPVPLRHRVEDRRDAARLAAVAFDDDVLEVGGDATVDLPVGRLRRKIVVAKFPFRRQTHC